MHLHDDKKTNTRSGQQRCILGKRVDRGLHAPLDRLGTMKSALHACATTEKPDATISRAREDGSEGSLLEKQD